MIGAASASTLRRSLAFPEHLRWFVASRIAVLGGFLVLYARGPAGYFGPRLERSPVDLLGAWDGVWYVRVAAHGYLLVPGHQSDPAFFPLFPILIRGAHALGLPYVAAEVLIANVAAAVAVVGFYRLSCRLLPERLASRATVFLALSPMGFVLSMGYPESLLLALVVFAALAALDGRWHLAALLAALGVLARPEALLLFFPFAAIARRSWSTLGPGARGGALAAILAGPAALASFLLYLQWDLGDARAWGQAQELWGRSFRLAGPVRGMERLPQLIHADPWLARDAVLLVVYLVLLVATARRTTLGPEWILAGAFVLVLPLFSGTVESEGRFGLLALPVYWGAATFTLPRWLERGLRVGLLALGAAAVVTLPFVWP